MSIRSCTAKTVCSINVSPRPRLVPMSNKSQRRFNAAATVLLLFNVLSLNCTTAQAQKKSKYICEEAQPESMCNASNTCGSASSVCTVDITRSSESANVKADIP